MTTMKKSFFPFIAAVAFLSAASIRAPGGIRQSFDGQPGIHA